MSAPRLSIDRIAITLNGVPEAIGEIAAGGLEQALRRRLGGLRPDALARLQTDSGRIELGRMEIDGPTDGAALAELIAERLVGMLEGGEGWH